MLWLLALEVVARCVVGQLGLLWRRRRSISVKVRESVLLLDVVCSVV